MKQLLVYSRHTNVRFSAAILLAHMVPNRQFRQMFTTNRNMQIPFRMQTRKKSESSESESEESSEESDEENNNTNLEFDSPECKVILHRIIDYLLSSIEDIGAFFNQM